MAPKKQTIEEKQGYNSEAPDTSSDELIAQLIAGMEKLDVKSMEKHQVENLLNMTKKIVKTWNDKDKMTPEERKKLNETKAKERADEKKRLTAEKREKVFTVNFIFKGTTYQIEVPCHRHFAITSCRVFACDWHQVEEEGHQAFDFFIWVRSA